MSRARKNITTSQPTTNSFSKDASYTDASFSKDSSKDSKREVSGEGKERLYDPNASHPWDFPHASSQKLPHSASEPLPPSNREGALLRPQGTGPITEGQAAFVRAMETHTITLCAGPAGSGKTFLSLALGYRMLMHRQFERLILVRPAIEAGEKLGFLPGSFKEKIDPYLVPLFSTLHKFAPAEKIASLLAKGYIEAVPLAYMRGRTLDDAFVILDEAQNANRIQTKMFLTRLGRGSKMVVVGDPDQTDLPLRTRQGDEGQSSGLEDAIGRLTQVPDIAICSMGLADVVRHPLISAILMAYAK